MFSAMLTDAYREDDIGLDFRFRSDEKLFNLYGDAKTKFQDDTARDFLFADDYPV